MQQPIHVEIVREGASLLGPILIAAGAVIAAVLTVVTANRRHRDQLLHDRNLQHDQLDHDRELRRLQMEQDRDLRYREHVSQVIDLAIEAAEELDRDLWRQTRSVISVEAERTKAEQGHGDASEELADLEGALIDEGTDVYRLLTAARRKSIRLRLRLGKHAIYQGLSTFLDRVEERLNRLDIADDRNRTAEEIEADKAAAEAVVRARNGFFSACEHWHTEMGNARAFLTEDEQRVATKL